jgi:hypothetical protein
MNTTTHQLRSRLLDRFTLLALITFILFSATSCKEDDETTPPAPGNTVNFTLTTLADGTIQVEGSTNQSVTFQASNKYLLKNFVYVEDGGILSIEPGTIIKGEKASKGSLIIKQGGKINAVGTATSPIIFTSEFAPGSRNSGDWGGLIICGRAPINVAGGTAIVEGGPDASFGGTNPADNSGTLSYVRIEFGGIAFQPNNEINGLTMAGVGSGTTINNVQVSYSGDDAFEMFGGTVNLKNIISYRNLDDDFDTDFGYRGNVQFAVALRDPALADISGSNGFESDNDATGSTNNPQTLPLFSNVTIVGPMATTSTTGYNTNYKRAAHLRRNTAASIYNSLLMGFPNGLFFDGSLSENNATNNDLQFRNNILAGILNDTIVASGSTFNFANYFVNQGGIQISNEVSDINMQGAFNLTSPILIPGAGSAALSGANFTGRLTSSFFMPVSYLGAFGITDWTNGWASWNPQTAVY